LTICGIVQDERYFAERVAPHIDGDRVVFLGAVGPQRRAEVLGAATALLHLIDFAEPFGLSVVESMICGTPVVAFGRGSMPEVVDEGVTGFLVHTMEQAVTAVDRVAAIDRAACRARAMNRFDAGRMVEDYLAVYGKLVHQPLR
jgi:glycosyltransferase involved in cell wall biosynthesis